MNYEQQSQAVAAEVRAELARQRISAIELAQRLPLSLSTLQRRLSGDIPFDVEEICMVAKVLNVSPGQFFPAHYIGERKETA